MTHVVVSCVLCRCLGLLVSNNGEWLILGRAVVESVGSDIDCLPTIKIASSCVLLSGIDS
jgi:hypothetical protein